MKIRIDLKIIMFLIIFSITNQLRIYLMVMSFCFLHELGHIIMGIVLRMKLEKIEVLPCGFSSAFSICKGNQNKEYSMKKIMVALAGPVVSFGLALMFQYINVSMNIKQEVIYSNILILVFNLMPLYPLDGGRIIKEIIYMKFGNIKAEYITNKVSSATIILLTIISSIAVYYFKNVAIFLVCICLWQIILESQLKQKIKLGSI